VIWSGIDHVNWQCTQVHSTEVCYMSSSIYFPMPEYTSLLLSFIMSSVSRRCSLNAEDQHSSVKPDGETIWGVNVWAKLQTQSRQLCGVPEERLWEVYVRLLGLFSRPVPQRERELFKVCISPSHWEQRIPPHHFHFITPSPAMYYSPTVNPSSTGTNVSWKTF